MKYRNTWILYFWKVVVKERKIVFLLDDSKVLPCTIPCDTLSKVGRVMSLSVFPGPIEINQENFPI